MTENRDTFAGDRKSGQSILHKPEAAFRNALIRFVPCGVETYHLTMMTLLWCVLVILFSWFACYDIRWLWGASLAIAGQYITDLLDGAIGRERDTGLIKWGFYMDHFLDYLFLCSLMIGYALLLPPASRVLMFFTMAIFGAYMVNSFLQFAATNEFQIAYMGVGPTEMRIVFILLNAVLVVSEGAVLTLMPIVLWMATLGLVVTVFRTQKKLWDKDMQARLEAGKELPKPSSEAIFVRRAIVSFALVSLAFGVTAGRILEPLHLPLGLLLYVCSWLPLVDAFRRTRKPASHVTPWQDRTFQVRVFAIAVGVLLMLGWASFTLAPPLRPGAYDAVQIRKHVGTDLQQVSTAWEQFGKQITALEQAVDDVPADASPRELRTAVEAPLEAVCTSMVQFNQLALQYSTFAHVDMTEAPTDHADAFLVAYTGLVAKYRSVAFLVPLVARHERLSPLVQAAFSKAFDNPVSPSEMAGELLRPDELVRLGGGTTYIRMLENEWQRELPDPERQTIRRLLRDEVKREAGQLARAIRENREAFLFPIAQSQR